MAPSSRTNSMVKIYYGHDDFTPGVGRERVIKGA